MVIDRLSSALWACLFGVLATAAGAADRLTAVADPADGRYVYLDDRGTIVLPGPYVRAERFSGGLGRVSGPPGITVYLKPDGKEAFSVPVPFSDTAGFSEGLAAFVRRGLVGFVDTQGREVIGPRFSRDTPLPSFQGGRAVVARPPVYGWVKANGVLVEAPALALAFSQNASFLPVEGGFQLVDVDGKPVGTDTYQKASGFSEGLAAVTVAGKTGWVDPAGKLLTFDAESVGSFLGGTAVFQRGGRQGLVDKKGKEVLAADKFAELAAVSAPSDPVRLWKFREQENGPWGLLADKGVVVAKAQWDDVGVFSEALAVVRVGTQTGLITAKGVLVAPLADLRLGPVHEGMAVFQKGDAFGFADAKAKVVLEAKWTAATDFSSGLAAVSLGEAWGLVDKKGKPVGPQNYQGLGALEGKRRRFVQNGLTGYLDDKGSVALPAVFEAGSDFHGGVAWVMKDGQAKLIGPDGKDFGPPGFELASDDSLPPFRVVKQPRYGLIDPKGNFVLPAVYDALWPGAGGPHVVFPVSKKPAPVFFADDKGDPALSLDGWVPVSAFRDRRAFVQKVGDGKGEIGLVDEKGTLVAQGFRGFRGGFDGGVACVQFAGGQWGYIDPSGKPLFGLQWDQAQGFSEGLAAVAYEDTWGYIDTQGTKIIPYQYARAGAFRNGLAEVVVGESPAFITKTGQRVWP